MVLRSCSTTRHFTTCHSSLVTAFKLTPVSPQIPQLPPLSHLLDRRAANARTDPACAALPVLRPAALLRRLARACRTDRPLPGSPGSGRGFSVETLRYSRHGTPDVARYRSIHRRSMPNRRDSGRAVAEDRSFRKRLWLAQCWPPLCPPRIRAAPSRPARATALVARLHRSMQSKLRRYARSES